MSELQDVARWKDVATQNVVGILDPVRSGSKYQVLGFPLFRELRPVLDQAEYPVRKIDRPDAFFRLRRIHVAEVAGLGYVDPAKTPAAVLLHREMPQSECEQFPPAHPAGD